MLILVDVVYVCRPSHEQIRMANSLTDIRTYFVTPLNEECGLIEWVNNVRALRDILLKSYKAKRIPVNVSVVSVSSTFVK